MRFESLELIIYNIFTKVFYNTSHMYHGYARVKYIGLLMITVPNTDADVDLSLSIGLIRYLGTFM